MRFLVFLCIAPMRCKIPGLSAKPDSVVAQDSGGEGVGGNKRPVGKALSWRTPNQ